MERVVGRAATPEKRPEKARTPEASTISTSTLTTKIRTAISMPTTPINTTMTTTAIIERNDTKIDSNLLSKDTSPQPPPMIVREDEFAEIRQVQPNEILGGLYIRFVLKQEGRPDLVWLYKTHKF